MLTQVSNLFLFYCLVFFLSDHKNNPYRYYTDTREDMYNVLHVVCCDPMNYVYR